MAFDSSSGHHAVHVGLLEHGQQREHQHKDHCRVTYQAQQISRSSWEAEQQLGNIETGHIIHQLAHRHKMVEHEIGTANKHEHLGNHAMVLLDCDACQWQ